MKKSSLKVIKSNVRIADRPVTKAHALNFFWSLLLPSAKGLQPGHSVSYVTSHRAAVTIPMCDHCPHCTSGMCSNLRSSTRPAESSCRLQASKAEQRWKPGNHQVQVSAWGCMSSHSLLGPQAVQLYNKVPSPDARSSGGRQWQVGAGGGAVKL